MTNQEAFNRVWKRAKNLRQAKSPSAGCMYRHPEGIKCFVGELIPDEHYDPAMEGYTSNRLFDHFPEQMAKAGLINVDKRLLSDMQNIHDWGTPASWDSALRDLAVYYNLTVPE